MYLAGFNSRDSVSKARTYRGLVVCLRKSVHPSMMCVGKNRNTKPLSLVQFSVHVTPAAQQHHHSGIMSTPAARWMEDRMRLELR
jgi:hypothetical protein